MKTQLGQIFRGARGTWVAALLLAGHLFLGCSPKESNAPHASNTLTGERIQVAGARPEFPGDLVPARGGFFEVAYWDVSKNALQIKGWAPADVRNESVRFVVRDPHDRLLAAGAPTFALQPRPDVAAAYPTHPDLVHSGFTASVPLQNLPAHAQWTDTLELYCLDNIGGFFRLQRAEAPTRVSWDRRADRFEVVLTYTQPVLTVPEKTRGSLDVAEPAAGSNAVRLAGWADFDGRSPHSVLIVQLAPRFGPASIQSCVWVPRPDVRAAVDAPREELDRCGFEVFLQFNGTLDSLREPGALRLWSINAAKAATEIGLPALRQK